MKKEECGIFNLLKISMCYYVRGLILKKKITETFTLMYILKINAIYIVREFIEKIQHRFEIYYEIIIFFC